MRTSYRTDSAGTGSARTRYDRWRVDDAALGGVITTTEGYLRVPARIAKAGVLRYPDGRELVPPETLSDPEFLASLEYKPVTLEHPPGPVTPATIQKYRVGMVLAPVVFRDGYVWGTLQLDRQDAIDAFKSGKAIEVSPGYKADTEETSGVDPVHGAYDRIQTRRYAGNHIAMTQRARGGRDIGFVFRNDSQILEDDPPMLSAPVLALLAALAMTGGDYTSDEDALKAAAIKAAEAVKGGAEKPVDPALAKEIADLKASIPAKDAELAALKLRYAELVEKTEGAESAQHELMEAVQMGPVANPDAMVTTDGQKMDSELAKKRANNLAKLHGTFTKLAGEKARVDSLAAGHKIEDADKMGLLQKRKAVAMKLDSTIADGESDDYYKARIDAHKATRKDSDNLPNAGGLGSTLNQDRTDSQAAPARVRPSAIAAKVHTFKAPQ